MLEYPRPQFVRAQWQSLDGDWRYSFDEADDLNRVGWQGDIRVPYPPESALSGVHDTSYHPVIWYKRSFTLESQPSEHIVLHFGAVDYAAEVWVNGRLVATHEGGHTPFSADIGDCLQEGEQTLIVRAADDPLDLHKPRGKQDWEQEPHGIWYPRTTGIWQSVWLESVPATHISKLRLTPNAVRFGVLLEAEVSRYEDSQYEDDVRLEVVFKLGDKVLAEDSLNVTGTSKRFIHFPDPGIDAARRALLWRPEQPNLIGVSLKLRQGETVLDEVESYMALRSVEARNGKFYLNGRPYFLRLALDQGYWDESLLAAPDDDALKKDVELAKEMGFNGVRKHQKIEHPRYLYWADKLGLLVWAEMPSAYAFGSETVQRLTREWTEVIKRDYNHPCIVTWVCFNESWGVPDLPHSAAQRNLVAALYHLTKALDSSRPVVGNDGWEHVVTDLLTMHDYNRDPQVLAERYGTPKASEHTSFEVLLEHGRISVLDDAHVADEPILLTEFGGIRYNPQAEEAGWGYQEVDSPEKLLEIYTAMIEAVSTGGLAGFCYTQFADTFQEQNGLLYSDRRPKVALKALHEATRGKGVRRNDKSSDKKSEPSGQDETD